MLNEILDNVASSLLRAIHNGLKAESVYPTAYIKQNGALVIRCLKDDDRLNWLKIVTRRYTDEFDSLINFFADVCTNCNIPKLPEDAVYCSKREIPFPEDQAIFKYKNKAKSSVSGGITYTQELEQLAINLGGIMLVEYCFNISPDAFDSLLLKKSALYTSYRNTEPQGGSILLLANPLLNAYKKGVICLAPVSTIDGQFLLRTAGCNTSEIISAQLTYLVEEHLPSQILSKKMRFGHHASAIVDCLADPEDLVQASMQCLNSSSINIPSFQEIDGTMLFEKTANCEEWITNMNPNAHTIYRLLGVLNPEELSLCQSLEIPAIIFMKQLLDHTNKKLEKLRNDFQDEDKLTFFKKRSLLEYQNALITKITTRTNNIEQIISKIEPYMAHELIESVSSSVM